MPVAKKLVTAKFDSFVDDVREPSLAVVKSGGPVAAAKSEAITLFKTGVISSFAPVVAEIKNFQAEEVVKPMPYKPAVIEPEIFVPAPAPYKPFIPFMPVEEVKITLPVVTPEEKPLVIDIGSSKVPETGGIIGSAKVEGSTGALNKNDMSFLNKIVDKIVGKDKLTGNAKTDSAQILKTANKVISTSKSVTGALKEGVKSLGSFVPGGALAVSAIEKFAGTGSGAPLVAAGDDKEKKDTPAWMWPVIIIGGLLLLASMFGKKLFK